jgi:hypothetical protein
VRVTRYGRQFEELRKGGAMHGLMVSIVTAWAVLVLFLAAYLGGHWRPR